MICNVPTIDSESVDTFDSQCGACLCCVFWDLKDWLLICFLNIIIIMANKTVKDAKTVHGTNPQYLVETIIRTRIYECRYWKEDCFGLTADLIVDKGAELRYIGGIYGGNIKPTPFLCLTLKLLQIQPDKDIIIEFIRQDHFK